MHISSCRLDWPDAHGVRSSEPDIVSFKAKRIDEVVDGGICADDMVRLNTKGAIV